LIARKNNDWVAGAPRAAEASVFSTSNSLVEGVTRADGKILNSVTERAISGASAKRSAPATHPHGFVGSRASDYTGNDRAPN